MIDKFNKLFSFQGFDSFILGYGFAHLVLDTTYWLGLIFIALSFAGAYGNATRSSSETDRRREG